MLEVEGQDRKSHPLRKRHRASVDEAEIEIGEASVDLDSTANSPRGQERDVVLAGDEGFEEQARAANPDTSTKKLVDLDEHRPRNEQLAAELGDERRGEPMCSITSVRRGDERPGIGDDSQRAATGSRR